MGIRAPWPAPDDTVVVHEGQTFFENLPVNTYGHHFNMARSTKASQPTDYRIDQRRRCEVLQRDGFACVYCRERASMTLIERTRAIIELSAASLATADGTPGMYKLDEPESKTFFGHDVDHPLLRERALLKSRIDNDLDRNIRDRRVVNGCIDLRAGIRFAWAKVTALE